MTTPDAAQHEREEWEYEEEDRRVAMSRARTEDEYLEAARGILGPGDLPARSLPRIPAALIGDARGTMDPEEPSDAKEDECQK
jgi:hypothetical protein